MNLKEELSRTSYPEEELLQVLAHAENTQLVLIGQWDAVQEAAIESLW